MSERPYGCSAIIVRRPYGKPDSIQVQIHRKGSLAAITRAAKLTSGFIRLISTDSYTREEYLRVFGEGRM